MSYAIRKDLPVPDARRGPGRKPTYPFGTMQVGDSFTVPIRSDETGIKVQSRIRAALAGHKRRHETTAAFITRISLDGKHVTVWCVEPKKAKRK
jgi:hypothetical protein